MKRINPVLILSFTLLVVMLGYGMILPVMPFYIEELGVGGVELGWLMSAYSLMQLIFAPLWGFASDRLGRKPVLMIGIAGYALAMLFMGLARSFWMLFAARVLSGVLSAATLPTALAFVGDETPEEERGEGMGRLSAATGIGVVAGPLLGGLLSSSRLSLPFFVGSGVAFAALGLVFLLLPESRPRRKSTERERFSIRAALRIAAGPPGVLLLMVFVLAFGLANFQGIAGLYVVDKFRFDTRQVGMMWMLMGAVMALAQGWLTGPLIRRFGERALVFSGLAGGAAGFIAMSMAVNQWTIYLSLGLFTLALALGAPAMNAALSRLAGSRQGAVMGLNSAATSLGRVAGPLWAGYLYDLNIEFPFYCGAAVLFADFLISLAAWKADSPKGQL